MDDECERAARAKRGSPFLNGAQTAHYLDISLRRLQRLNAAGKGPPVRRHSHFVRYHIDELEAWSKGELSKDKGHD